jgi:hypothetical protein
VARDNYIRDKIHQDTYKYHPDEGFTTTEGFDKQVIVEKPAWAAEIEENPSFKPVPMPGFVPPSSDKEMDPGFHMQMHEIPQHIQDAVKQESQAREQRGEDPTIHIKPNYPDAYYEREAIGKATGAYTMEHYIPSFEFTDNEGNKIEVKGAENGLDKLAAAAQQDTPEPPAAPQAGQSTPDNPAAGQIANNPDPVPQKQGIEITPLDPPPEAIEPAAGEVQGNVIDDINSTTYHMPKEQVDALPGDTIAEKEAKLEEDIAHNSPGAEIDVNIDCDTPGGGDDAVVVKKFEQEDSVNKIQTHLIGTGKENVGDAENNPDGMFGKGTSRALEEELKGVQERNNLEPTGEYDQQTRDALTAERDALPEGVQRDSVSSFIEGLDEMKANDVDGVPALDRVYNPDTNDASDPNVCRVDIDIKSLPGPNL